MSGPVEIVLIVAAIGYLLLRRLMGEPAQAKRMLVLPAVLSVIGLADLSGSGVVKSPASLAFLFASAAIGVVLGALRGVSVRISRRDDVAIVGYTAVTVVLWLVNIGARFALGALHPGDDGLLLTLGLGILAEGLVVLYRALRGGHRVMWTQTGDGAPVTSPMLEHLGGRWNTRTGRDHL